MNANRPRTKNPKCDVIVIDVGNTSTSIGHWDGTKVTALSAVRGGIRVPDEAAKALDKAGAKTAKAAILASVVPAVNAKWAWFLKRLYGIRLDILSNETPLPVDLSSYENPASIGADRLCDAVGAFVRHGKPVAIADFGTALTFDVVDANGAYIGGLIAPGLPLMSDYLHEKTAQLPSVDLRAKAPAWGDNTENAMRLGALYAHRGMVREIMAFIRTRTGASTAFCATGGYAAWALNGFDGISVEPDLTLFGLGCIWSYAHGR